MRVSHQPKMLPVHTQVQGVGSNADCVEGALIRCAQITWIELAKQKDRVYRHFQAYPES